MTSDDLIYCATGITNVQAYNIQVSPIKLENDHEHRLADTSSAIVVRLHLRETLQTYSTLVLLKIIITFHGLCLRRATGSIEL